MKSQHQLTVKDLAAAVQNAKSESVNSLLIQLNGVNYPVVNAKIQNIGEIYYEEKLVIFGETNKPAATKSFFSFGTKAKSPPVHNQITPAVIATIEQLFSGSDITTKSLNEIKTALSEVNAHFEQLSNAQNPLNSINRFGGAL